LELWFRLTCPITALRDEIPGLDGSGGAEIRLRIVYNRAALLEAFKQGAAANGVDLVRVRLDPWIRERINDEFQKFGLTEDERNNLRRAVWMAAGPQQMVLTYPIDGEDGAAVLHFVQGWTGIGVASNGQRLALKEIAECHKGVVQAVRERLGIAG
jgi:hypothetical protein